MEPTAPSAAYCTKCGAALLAGDRFCGRCGEPLRAFAEQTPWAPAAAPMTGPVTAYGAVLSSWWPRVGSMLLDSLVLAVPTLVINALFAHAHTHAGAAAGSLVADMAIGAAYFGLLNGTGTGQTLGNRAAGIAVRDVRDNTVIGLGRGLLRWFVRFALYLFLVLPGILSDLWPLWDGLRQTLADKAANSVMIRVR